MSLHFTMVNTRWKDTSWWVTRSFRWIASVKVYDLSLTSNVVQMILALIVLVCYS